MKPYYKPPPKPRPFLNVSQDFGAINKTYRERLGGPWFECEPLKPVSKCAMCSYTHDPNTGITDGTCSGSCQY